MLREKRTYSPTLRVERVHKTLFRQMTLELVQWAIQHAGMWTSLCGTPFSIPFEKLGNFVDGLLDTIVSEIPIILSPFKPKGTPSEAKFLYNNNCDCFYRYGSVMVEINKQTTCLKVQLWPKKQFRFNYQSRSEARPSTKISTWRQRSMHIQRKHTK